MDPLSSFFALIGLATIVHLVTKWGWMAYWWSKFGELPPTSQTYQVDLLNEQVKYLQLDLDREKTQHLETKTAAKANYDELKHEFDQLTNGLITRIGE